MTDRPPLPPQSAPFAEKLAFLRRHHRPRMTQASLARRMGRTDQMGGLWERGTVEPANDIKLQMALLFDVEPTYLGWEADADVGPTGELPAPYADAVIARIDELLQGHSPAVGTVPADVKTIQEDVGYIRTRLDTLIAQVEALTAHAGVTVVGSAPAARESRA